jgi:hypothetical protein
MGMSVCPTSPKYGYGFDTQEHDVRKARKRRQCEGGRHSRASHFPGPRVEGCTDFIEVGDVYVATILNMFSSESSACLPCALAIGAVHIAAVGATQ